MDRAFFIGKDRELDALITLKHDHNLQPAFDKTFIISHDEVKDYLEDELGSQPTFIYVPDDMYMEPKWLSKGYWIAQQMLKLKFLQTHWNDVIIQDCDLFAVKPYNWENNFLVRHPRPKLETTYEIFDKLMPPTLTVDHNYYYITEFMPVKKVDFSALKRSIELRTGRPMLDAIWHILSNMKEPRERVWFSEYELLGALFRTRNPEVPLQNQDRFDLGLNWPNQMNRYRGERFMSNPSAVTLGEINDFYTAIENFNGKRG